MLTGMVPTKMTMKIEFHADIEGTRRFSAEELRYLAEIERGDVIAPARMSSGNLLVDNCGSTQSIGNREYKKSIRWRPSERVEGRWQTSAHWTLPRTGRAVRRFGNQVAHTARRVAASPMRPAAPAIQAPFVWTLCAASAASTR